MGDVVGAGVGVKRIHVVGGRFVVECDKEV